MKLNNKSQNFSTDIVIVVIIILFGALTMVMYQINQTKESNLDEIYLQASKESNLIINNFRNDQIINGENEVNLERLRNLDHEELKEELGLSNDFAIVFEKDGKLVKIDPGSNVNCVGSSNIIVNGEVCDN